MDSERLKHCSGCKVSHPVSAFGKNRSTKDGLQGTCKIAAKKYQQENKEKLSKYYHDRYFSRHEEFLEARRDYYYRNIEAFQNYREEHKEERRANFYSWLERNPESNRARSLRWRRLSIEGLSAEDVAISACYRKAIKNDLCYYCSRYKSRMQVDHYFPVSKGGKDFWWNLVRACQRCNNKKSAKCGTYFMLKIGRFLNDNNCSEIRRMANVPGSRSGSGSY